MGEKTKQLLKDYSFHISITSIVLIASFLISIGIGYEKMQAKIKHIDGKTDLYAERWEQIERRVDNNEKQIELHYLEIITRLKSLETSGQEIKQLIREHDIN